jgi:hypothetical protein
MDGTDTVPSNLRFHKLLDDNALEQIASNVVDKFWGWMKIVGNITSGFLGLYTYVIYRFINYLLHVIVTTKIVYNLFGWCISIIAAISGALSKYLIHRKMTYNMIHLTPLVLKG